MKKRNSWIGAVLAATLLVGVQTAQAGTVADGAYIGIQGGFGTAIVDAQTTDNDGAGTSGDSQTFGFNEGGIGLDGGSYGAFMGYGFRMGSFYAGMEVNSNWSSLKFDPGTITVDPDDFAGDNNGTAGSTITSASAELEYTTGVSGRLGFYINPSTLFVLNGGLSGSQFEVAWGKNSESYWDPGASYGLGIESTLFDGVAVRLNWTYTDYYDAEVFGIGSITEKPGNVSVEIQPTMSVAHLGLMYTF
jgi:hypothetical protein